MANNPQKRTHPDSDSDSDYYHPTFLCLEPQEGSAFRLSPFAVNKAILGIAGDVKNIKKMVGGAYLIEVKTKAQAKNLLKTTTFVDVPCKVTPHKTLNYSKGVIRCSDLLHCSSDEICDELKSQGVVASKQIEVTRDGEKIKTSTFILTFCKPQLPKNIKAGYLNLPVDIYIPNPLRCYKCQKFGHGSNNCQHQEVCAKCSLPGHKDQDCPNQLKCANCKGNHAAYSRVCPKFKHEKDIVYYKYRNGVTFPEARKAIATQREHFDKLMSEALKPKMVSTSTQTDMPQPQVAKTTPAVTPNTKSTSTASQKPQTSTSTASQKLQSSTSTTSQKPQPSSEILTNKMPPPQTPATTKIQHQNSDRISKYEKNPLNFSESDMEYDSASEEHDSSPPFTPVEGKKKKKKKIEPITF